MVKYTFKLIKSYVPDLTQKTEQDKLYGGIRLIYKIYKSFYIQVFKREICIFKKSLGKKTFLRPYKKYWDKHTYRLPYVYWGKKSHPLTRLWVVIPNEYPLGVKKITPEINLIHQYVELFGHKFRSKDITTRLFGRTNSFNLISTN